MIIGIVALYAGYTIGLWGYCLIRGYNVTPKDLLNYKFPSTVSSASPNAAASPGTSAQQAASQGLTPSTQQPGVRPGPVGGPQPVAYDTTSPAAQAPALTGGGGGGLNRTIQA